jgi:hypothetical protein
LGVDQELDGNSSGMGGSKLQVLPGILFVVIRCVTVKTSLLKQRCKTILEDASGGLFNFEISRRGNFQNYLHTYYQPVMEGEGKKESRRFFTVYWMFKITLSKLTSSRIRRLSFT